MIVDPKPFSILQPNCLPSPVDYCSGVDDLYTQFKKLKKEIEFIDIQEEYLKDEYKNLKNEYLIAQKEVKRIQTLPLIIGELLEMVDQNSGIIASTTGTNYHVRILSTINRELLKPCTSVALHRHSYACVDVLPAEADSGISLMSQSEKPDVCYDVSFIVVSSLKF